MGSQEIQIVAVGLLLALIVWPDIVLQVVGFALILAAPFDIIADLFSLRGLPIWTSFVVGLVLIGLGRIGYHMKLVTRMFIAANPEAAAQTPRKRLGF